MLSMLSKLRVSSLIQKVSHDIWHSLSFNLGGESGTWFIDLKNGAGAVGSGDPTSGAADVTFTLKDTDFISMFQGKLKPTNAFMTGKLKLSGDMGKAMALEKMMKKMNSRGYHTMSGKSKL